jgi:hypothetical protein
MKRLNPTTVIACIALAVSLGGTGYAARSALLPANSVGSKQVINHSISKIDLKAPLPRGARGLRGPEGPEGSAGPNGPTGPAGGFTAANIVYSLPGPIAHMCGFDGGACAYGESIAHCPAGKVAIGGAWGGDAPDAPFAATVEGSFPTYPAGSTAGSLPDGWGVKMVNNDTGTASFHATAVCAG